MSRLSGIKNLVGLGLNKPLNPLTGLLLAGFGGSLRRDIAEDFNNEGERRELEQTKRVAHAAKMRALIAGRRAIKERDLNRNLDFLRQNAPEVHDAVLAGRRLPQDAVVLGGTPRQDLLSELARNMQAPQPNPNNPF